MGYDALTSRLLDGDWQVRASAVRELREALPDSLEYAFELMRSENWRLRAGGAAVLDHAPQDERVERALLDAAGDPDARVRQSALHSLACAECKPDGCVTPDALDVQIDVLMHDPSVRLRRKVAGGMMWGQQGRGDNVIGAFRHLLATDPDRVLRERAATFLASCEIPRESMPYREWIGTWKRRVAQLLDDGVAA